MALHRLPPPAAASSPRTMQSQPVQPPPAPGPAGPGGAPGRRDEALAFLPAVPAGLVVLTGLMLELARQRASAGRADAVRALEREARARLGQALRQLGVPAASLPALLRLGLVALRGGVDGVRRFVAEAWRTLTLTPSGTSRRPSGAASLPTPASSMPHPPTPQRRRGPPAGDAPAGAPGGNPARVPRPPALPAGAKVTHTGKPGSVTGAPQQAVEKAARAREAQILEQAQRLLAERRRTMLPAGALLELAERVLRETGLDRLGWNARTFVALALGAAAPAAGSSMPRGLTAGSAAAAGAGPAPTSSPVATMQALRHHLERLGRPAHLVAVEDGGVVRLEVDPERLNPFPRAQWTALVRQLGPELAGRLLNALVLGHQGEVGLMAVIGALRNEAGALALTPPLLRKLVYAVFNFEQRPVKFHDQEHATGYRHRADAGVHPSTDEGERRIAGLGSAPFESLGPAAQIAEALRNGRDLAPDFIARFLDAAAATYEAAEPGSTTAGRTWTQPRVAPSFADALARLHALSVSFALASGVGLAAATRLTPWSELMRRWPEIDAIDLGAVYPEVYRRLAQALAAHVHPPVPHEPGLAEPFGRLVGALFGAGAPEGLQQALRRELEERLKARGVSEPGPAELAREAGALLLEPTFFLCGHLRQTLALDALQRWLLPPGSVFGPALAVSLRGLLSPPADAAGQVVWERIRQLTRPAPAAGFDGLVDHAARAVAAQQAADPAERALFGAVARQALARRLAGAGPRTNTPTAQPWQALDPAGRERLVTQAGEALAKLLDLPTGKGMPIDAEAVVRAASKPGVSDPLEVVAGRLAKLVIGRLRALGWMLQPSALQRDLALQAAHDVLASLLGAPLQRAPNARWMQLSPAERQAMLEWLQQELRSLPGRFGPAPR